MPQQKTQHFEVLLNELCDINDSNISSGITTDESLTKAHQTIKEKYPNDYKEFVHWIKS